MPRETLFFAQSFSRRGRKLVAGTAERFKTRDSAKEAAARMASTKDGAIAFEVTGDPESGDYDDPVVLFKEGTLPREMQD